MDDFLQHHGILGMKWGVRRYRNEDGTLTEAGKKRAQRRARREVRKDRKEAYKNRSILSDDELNKRVNRLEKERRLKDLSRSEIISGRTGVKNTIDRYGNQVAALAVGFAAGKLVRHGYQYLENYFTTGKGFGNGIVNL